jgi:hypothetical protein
METMERNTILDDTKSHVIVITDEILDKYSDPDYPIVSRQKIWNSLLYKLRETFRLHRLIHVRHTV